MEVDEETMSDCEEEADLKSLEEIKQLVDDQKASGNNMFVSGWDDDNDGIEEEVNPRGSSSSYIMWAAENGELDIVRNLVSGDHTLIGARDRDGYTPLHRACYNNHVNVVEYLLLAGADHHATTNDGWTPLHSAAHWNNALCAVKLLEAGADINAKTIGGQTPLHLAAAHGASKDTLELLLMHPKIKPNEVNGAGETPYMIAKRSGVFAPMFGMFEECVTQLADKRVC